MSIREESVRMLAGGGGTTTASHPKIVKAWKIENSGYYIGYVAINDVDWWVTDIHGVSVTSEDPLDRDIYYKISPGRLIVGKIINNLADAPIAMVSTGSFIYNYDFRYIDNNPRKKVISGYYAVGTAPTCTALSSQAIRFQNTFTTYTDTTEWLTSGGEPVTRRTTEPYSTNVVISRSQSSGTGWAIVDHVQLINEWAQFCEMLADKSAGDTITLTEIQIADEYDASDEIIT